jgi:hypothetical protein
MKQTMRSARRFSPPWTIDEANDACFVVRDKNGQATQFIVWSKRQSERTMFMQVLDMRNSWSFP